MTVTIAKKDMRCFMDTNFPKGYQTCHTFDIFTDLISVYDDNKEYTLEEFFIPFVVDIPYKQALSPQKSYRGDQIAVFPKTERVLAGGKVVKYKLYLNWLFYVSFIMKQSENPKVRLDVAGRITHDLFPDTFNNEKWYREYFGENYRDWRYRWHLDDNKVPHHFTLSDEEHRESDKLYDLYMQVKTANKEVTE